MCQFWFHMNWVNWGFDTKKWPFCLSDLYRSKNSVKQRDNHLQELWSDHFRRTSSGKKFIHNAEISEWTTQNPGKFW
jgi:hypothetical protein